MKISVITVTWNAARWVELTLRSVLCQTCTDYEHLIVDGASSDATMSIVRRYASLNPRLRWVSEPDHGLYDAMNKALRLAKGDFVWFINAGDALYDAATLGRVADAIDDTVDIVYGRTCVVNQEGVPIGEHHKPTPALLTRRSLLNGLVVSHQSIIVRRTIAAPYNTAYRISADYDWVLRAVSASRRNVFIDAPLSRFMTSGLSAKHRKRSWAERFTIMRHHYGLPLTLWAHLLIALRYPFSKKY